MSWKKRVIVTIRFCALLNKYFLLHLRIVFVNYINGLFFVHQKTIIMCLYVQCFSTNFLVKILFWQLIRIVSQRLNSPPLIILYFTIFFLHVPYGTILQYSTYTTIFKIRAVLLPYNPVNQKESNFLNVCVRMSGNINMCDLIIYNLW